MLDAGQERAHPFPEEPLPADAATGPTAALCLAAAGDAVGDAPAAAPGASAYGGTFWVQGFGSWGHMDGDGNAARLGRSIGGLVLGADALVGENWRIGLAGGYSHAAFDVGAYESAQTPPNTAPTVDAGSDRTASPSAPLTLSASFIDPDNGDSAGFVLTFGSFRTVDLGDLTGPEGNAFAILAEVRRALQRAGYAEAAREFILRTMRPRIEAAATSGHQHNFKSVLQQASQQILGQTPQYIILDEKGPDHAKCFEVCVEIGARRFTSSWGASKKQAEQDAALLALEELGFATRGDNGEIIIHYGDAGQIAPSEPVRAYDPDEG